MKKSKFNQTTGLLAALAAGSLVVVVVIVEVVAAGEVLQRQWLRQLVR